MSQAAEAALDRIGEITVLSSAEDAWGALENMQDAILAAEHTGDMLTVADCVEDAVAHIRAFPEGWTSVAHRATDIMDRRKTMALIERRLWAAVEAAAEKWTVHPNLPSGVARAPLSDAAQAARRPLPPEILAGGAELAHPTTDRRQVSAVRTRNQDGT